MCRNIPTKKSDKHRFYPLSKALRFPTVRSSDEPHKRTMRVLIADDSEILRRHLRNILTEITGIETVAEATTTDEAIAAFRQHQPDLVILDLRMPGEGGIAVLKAIHEQNPATPVIIFTDYPYPQYRKKCLEEGTSYFFEKSTESEKMIELIRQLVQSHK